MESALEEVAAEAVAEAVSKAVLYDLPPPAELETFSLRKSRFMYANKIMYRVYDKPGHFTLVEADSAHEAYAKSGVSNALKIEREAFFTHVAIEQDMLEPTDEQVLVEVNESIDKAMRFVDLIKIDADMAAAKQAFEPLMIGEVARANAAQKVAEPEAAEMPQTAGKPEPAAAEAPQETVEAAAEPETQEPPVAPSAAKEPEPEAEPPVQEAAAPSEVPDDAERELTPEEVNALMSGGDED